MSGRIERSAGGVVEVEFVLGYGGRRFEPYLEIVGPRGSRDGLPAACQFIIDRRKVGLPLNIPSVCAHVERHIPSAQDCYERLRRFLCHLDILGKRSPVLACPYPYPVVPFRQGLVLAAVHIYSCGSARSRRRRYVYVPDSHPSCVGYNGYG